MKIAICDDDYSVCRFIENTVLRYGKEKHIHMDVDVTQSKKSLIDNFEEDTDMLFLDIMLPDSTGVEIGHFLRKNIKNVDLQIIFISSNPDYALDLFKIRPMDFLIKPFTENDLIEILDEYFSARMPQVKYFSYKSKQTTGKIFYSDIVYISSNIRKINIFLKKGQIITIYGKLSDIEDVLPKEHFWRIHQSYIVNKHFILNCQFDFVQMITDEKIPISKNYRKEIRSKIIRG